MTLATVPPYDADRVPRRGDHAVVVGAGVAGLCAARVLADAFERVTVLDRDDLPDGPVPRRGVPQARQPHMLWEAGRATLEDLFPGFGEDLLAAGGVAVDTRRELHSYSRGGFLASGREPLRLSLATRPLYEALVRRHLRRVEGVAVRERCHCAGYLVDDDRDVSGVTVRTRAGGEEALRADLVVDATGRASRTPAWLERHGYDRPALDEVVVDVGYSSVLVERPPGDRRAIGVLAEAPRTRGGAAMPVEGDRWLVNLHGVHGDHPPTDEAGLVEFAASLPTPELERLLVEHPWTADSVAVYRFPSNRRYRYEALDRAPRGLVAVGDAVASFNPVYGQGMSVAALEAVALGHALAADGLDDLWLRFYAAAEPAVDVAWRMATGADFAYARTEGERPLGAGLFDRYLSRLLRRAHADPALTDAFNRVLTMQEPPTSLFRPSAAWRVLGPGVPSVGGRPASSTNPP